MDVACGADGPDFAVVGHIRADFAIADPAGH